MQNSVKQYFNGKRALGIPADLPVTDDTVWVTGYPPNCVVFFILYFCNYKWVTNEKRRPRQKWIAMAKITIGV